MFLLNVIVKCYCKLPSKDRKYPGLIRGRAPSSILSALMSLVSSLSARVQSPQIAIKGAAELRLLSLPSLWVKECLFA